MDIALFAAGSVITLSSSLFFHKEVTALLSQLASYELAPALTPTQLLEHAT
jgi:hypothetical protein